MKIVGIPPEIEILGITYVVDYVDELEGMAAQIHFLEGTIDIRTDMNPEIQFLSFMHEVTHGILQGLNHHMKDRIYHDEDFVEQLGQAYAQVIKQLVEYNDKFEVERIPDEDEEMPEKDILNIGLPEGYT